MKIFLSCLLSVGTFIFSCNKNEADTAPISYSVPAGGEYQGVKIFTNANQTKATRSDSVQVSLTIGKQTGSNFTINGLMPSGQGVTAQVGNQNGFNYDRGQGIDQCGVTSMTGEGYFRGDSLFITETIRCNTATTSEIIKTIRIKAAKVR
ncbi:hypothetical protein [Telluribacter humicola]|uniref:hypothetical protein n=1 Tax=Telluribacter humicola TaxID=1720261 RepID=UPI001A9662BD|nr:hypothetical protein [Telluribacter humicola]